MNEDEIRMKLSQAGSEYGRSLSYLGFSSEEVIAQFERALSSMIGYSVRPEEVNGFPLVWLIDFVRAVSEAYIPDVGSPNAPW